MNDTTKPCHITKAEKSGALVRFEDGQLGYVPAVEFFWKWRRGRDPSLEFKENQLIHVVSSPGDRDGIPHYSYKRANRDPWKATLKLIRDLAWATSNHADAVEVVGTVVSALPDRVYVSVDEPHGFEVDAVLSRDRLPLDDFPTYANRPLNDFLLEGDRIRAVIDAVIEHSSAIYLSVRAIREQAWVAGRPAAGIGLLDTNARMQALKNRLEKQGESFVELKEYGSDHTVAVVCDDAELQPPIVMLLNAVGFTATVCASPSALPAVRPDVILLDVDRALARGHLDNDLRLWSAAAPGVKLVLLFSDVPAETLRQLRDAGDLFHGAVRKWFKPKLLLAAIRAALDGDGWRFDADHPPDGAAWREVAMLDAVDHDRNRDDALDAIVHQLQIGLGATAIALVHFNRQTRRTDLLASANIRHQDFETARTYLDKSPVRDIVEDHESYATNDVGSNDPTFTHLHKLLHKASGRAVFRSFLGTRLVDFGRGFVQTDDRDKPSHESPTAADERADYALLAFHTDPGAFPPPIRQLFCRAAVLILAVLERDATRREMVKFSQHMLVARQASFLLHEFRTRTTAVQLWNRLLEEDIDRLATVRGPAPEQLDQLRATSTSLNRVAEGLAQINELFLNLSMEGQRPFRIGSLIDELRLVFREQLREMSARLEVALPWDEEIKSHRGHITHILSNLIQNALDQFRLAECRRPEIRVMVEKVEPSDRKFHGRETVRVTVADNGIGVPHLNSDKIFEYNFSTKPDGSGIGLHVSRLIAENMRGSLVLETSERFFHTRFGFTFPL